MNKLMVGTLALLTAMVFAGGNLAFSAEATPSQPPAQAQVAPDTETKSEEGGKQEPGKAKKAQKAKKKKARKSTQPAN